jgi:hypothetical protein
VQSAEPDTRTFSTGVSTEVGVQDSVGLPPFRAATVAVFVTVTVLVVAAPHPHATAARETSA